MSFDKIASTLGVMYDLAEGLVNHIAENHAEDPKLKEEFVNLRSDIARRMRVVGHCEPKRNGP